MDNKKIADWQQVPELEGLDDLSNPPKHLFYIGSWSSDVFTHCVAVVGSRRMTSYGRQVLELMIPQLVQEGKTIVSGFMYGVDQYAHKLAVSAGGKTIAVLGWGISQLLSGSDTQLAHEIVDSGGLIISEWEEQKAALWTFPSRNRIIVALSQEVIVVEAAFKSGSLITAKLAEKLKRKLWAVPGQITSKTSEGTNELIAVGKAQMWRGTFSTTRPTDSSNPIITLIENEPLTPDQIARKMHKPVAEIGAELTLLALSGQVIERDGQYSLQ